MRAINKQSGLSIMGLLFASILIIFILILGMKLVPVYMTNMSIKKHLDIVAEDTGNEKLSPRETKVRMADRMNIDSIDFEKVVNPHDELLIIKENGDIELRLDYEVIVPIIGNLSGLVEFENSSYY